MGFSTSGATVVLFVGLLVAFGVFFSTLETGADRVVASTDDATDRALAQTNTEVAIGNASYDATGDVLTVRVNNTGARAVAVEQVTVLVDGRYVTPERTAVDGSAANDVLAPGETLTLTASVGTDPGRVKVVTGPGVAAVTTEV